MRGGVTAISHLHRRYGHPSPTGHPEVKQWLRLAAGLLAEPEPTVSTERIAQLLRQIPTTGWPAGLFGRRDRMLLITRYTADLTRTQLSALTTEHLSVDPDKLTITLDTDTFTLPRTAEPATCPGCAWILWRRMLQLLAHHAAARRLTDTLRHAIPLTDTGGHRCAHLKDRAFSNPMPIFLPMNRWGATAVTPTPISNRSISTLTTGYLTGGAPQRPDLHPPVVSTAAEQERPAPPVVSPTDLRTATERYLRGLEQRRRDVADLADVRNILAHVDHAPADLDARIRTWRSSTGCRSSCGRKKRWAVGTAERKTERPLVLRMICSLRSTAGMSLPANFHPHRHLPDQAAPSSHQAAATTQRGGLTPPSVPSASRRTWIEV